MIDVASVDRCRTFINCQMEPAKAGQRLPGVSIRPAVTISRQAGCGALVVAQKLAALLQLETASGDPPWTVFDRNLMEKVLEDHNLPTRLAQFLPEDRATELQDITNEFFGLRPGSWTVGSPTIRDCRRPGVFTLAARRETASLTWTRARTCSS